MIRFECGTCKERLVVPDRHAGRKGKCPGCGTINRVPRESEFAAPSDDEPPREAKPLPDRPRKRERPAAASGAPKANRVSPPAAARPAKDGVLDRLSRRLARKPTSPEQAEIDINDAGGIPMSVKLLIVAGILVLIPLIIGAVFVLMILLRVKFSN